MKFYLLFLLFPFIAIQSDALELTTQKWSYSIGPHLFSPGSTLRMIESSINLGVLTQLTVQAEPDKKDMSKLFADLITATTSQNEALNNERQRLIGIIQDLGESEAHQTTPGRAAPQAAAEPAPILLPVLDLNQFRECSRTTLPLLKTLIRIDRQEASDNAADLFGAPTVKLKIEAQVRLQRGNGQTRGRSGIACGAFLGAAGFEFDHLVMDVKFLSAILARQGNEARLLHEIAVVAFHEHTSIDVRTLWRKYWDYMSLKAVFTTEDLPTIEAVKLKFEQELFVDLPGGIRMVYAREDLDRLTAEGQALAQRLMR